MGLAASQARFLGITLRKANLEFKSTELAQQKLELTDQMARVSQEYSSAINATQLNWQNDAVCDENGNPITYGVTYSLLMMPSAANNYNPYMVSTRSGAIVLNSKYQVAAEAAGISKAGGLPSESGYKKFVAALEDQGLITNTTEAVLLNQNWHSSAGMGAIPKDKTSHSEMTIDDLISDPNFGEVTLDWLQVLRNAYGYDYDQKSTDVEYTNAIEHADAIIADLKLDYSKAAPPGYSNFGTEYVNAIYKMATDEVVVTPGNQRVATSGIMAQFQSLEDKISNEANGAKKLQYAQELEYLKNGLDPTGQPITDSPYGPTESIYKYPLYWAIYEKAKYQAVAGGGNDILQWNTDPTVGLNGNTIGFNQMFNTANRNIAGGSSGGFLGNLIQGYISGDAIYTVPGAMVGNEQKPDQPMAVMTMVQNDVILNDPAAIKSMTLGDLLTSNIVLMTNTKSNNSDVAANTLQIAGQGMLDYIARIFGYKSIGTGLNIDTSTDNALNQAYALTMRKFLSAKNAVDAGSKADDSNVLDNSAYINANSHNNIGKKVCDNQTYAALNLSNMVSAFLTYYDNFLRGSASNYVVGKSNDISPDGGAKTYFVTDDPGYIYLTNTQDALTNDEKINDFYSELYNSLCEHGWRYDGNLDDYEYLESTIKDGRYSLMALNTDGYFYQTRYNDVEYIVEEQDRNAIARAEADFTRKKAEITNKEDRIDMQTKKLDAEIMELTTEMNSVQNLISKSIEKTFAMFSN